MGNLGAAHRGYNYQDLVTAYHFALALTQKFESVTVDRKENSDDRFDDLTLHKPDSVLRRQIKSSEAADKRLELKHLTTVTSSNLEIDALVRCFKSAGANAAAEYRLCATWKEPVDELKDLLEVSNAAPTFSRFPTKLFRLRAEAIWAFGQPPTWRRLEEATDIIRQDFLDFADHFVIELEFPPASTDLNKPDALEVLLLDLLTDSIGIGRYPNNTRDSTDVARQLIQLAARARSEQRVVLRSEIESEIRLQKDFGRVAQQFPVEKRIEVERGELQDALRSNLNSSRLILTGAPGSGKSWALTEFADKLKNKNLLVARHYCYLEPGDREMQRRITANVLFANLIYELIEICPELRKLHQPIYAAGPRELENLLEQAFSKDLIEKCVLIVDGVDHISRVFAEAESLTLDDVDIIQELAMLKLPDGVCLVIGSQPGKHLDPLRENATELAVPGWSQIEVAELADNIGVLAALKKFDLREDEKRRFLKLLYERSEGNPLYATFLCRQTLNDLETGVVLDPFERLRETPQINGEISHYYEYLFDNLEKQDSFGATVAELLGTIDFGLTAAELKEIYPLFAHRIEPALAFLSPILIQTSAQGGTRIYHESFRRFVVNRLSERGGSVAEILKPVIDWLEKRDFFADAKAYRFLLPCLRRAGKSQEALKLVGTQFVSQSLAAGHPRRAIDENLKLVTRLAADELDWAALVRFAELHRSAIICFREKLLDVELFGRTFAAIFGADALNERLLFDGQPTFPAHIGLLFCSLCDDAGAAAPWANYLALEKSGDRRGSDEYSASDSNGLAEAAAIAEVHGALRTEGVDAVFPKFVRYLENNASPHRIFLRSALKRLMQFGGTETLSKLLETARMSDEAIAIILIELAKAQFADGDFESAKSTATKAIELDDTSETLVEGAALGTDSAKLVARLPNLTAFNIAVGDKRYLDDSDDLKNWVNGVKVVALVAPHLLDAEQKRVVGGTWYRNWLRFVIALSEAEAQVKTKATAAEEQIIGALKDLASDTRPFAGEPRACDLFRAHSLIRKTIVRALHLLQNNEAWDTALNYLTTISRETLVYLRGSPNGPLDPESLIETLIPFAADERLTERIARVVKEQVERTQRGVDYYETQAEQELQLASALAQIGRRDDALEFWRSATVKLCAYGFRKDTTIYELLQSAPSLLAAGKTEARAALAAVQPLVNAAVQHTDGKETRHTPVYWIEALSRADATGAAFVLARSFVRPGGAIDWRYESALEEFIDAVRDVGDARLVNSLYATLPFENGYEVEKRVRKRLSVIKKIFEDDFADGEHALRLFAAQVHGDAEDFDARVYADVQAFGRLYGIDLPNADCGIGENAKQENASFERRPEPFADFKKNPIFPVDADSAEIIAGIRAEWRGLRDDAADNNAFINAFGYRLVEMLNDGDEEKALQLLRYFAREGSFSRAGAPLAEIGAGLERHGFTEIAAVAYSLAYARSRGGGGWEVLGDKKQLPWLGQSFKLSPTRGARALANEVSHLLSEQQYIMGVARHLIEFCAEYEPQSLLLAWQAAFDVIRHRLPENEKDTSVFETYEPEATPDWTTDEAIVAVLLARVSHPELRRKNAALAGFADAVSLRPEAVTKPLKHFLSVDTPLSSVIIVLYALVEAEPDPFQVTTALQSEFLELYKSDVFGLRALSETLLARIGIVPGVNSTDISTLPMTQNLPERKLQAVLSLDWGARVENISRIWGEFPSLVARRFDYVWNASKTREDIVRLQREAAYSRLYRNLPPTPMLFWEKELFESVFQEVLAGINAQLSDEDETARMMLNELGVRVLPRVHPRVANFHSRTLRPSIPFPKEQKSGIDVVRPLPNSDEYAGWYRCGYFERELIIDEGRNYVEAITVMEGVQLQSNPDGIADEPPFLDIPADFWWATSESATTLNELSGCMVGLDIIVDLLGVCPVLVLHPAITSALKLRVATSWQRQLSLIDESNEVAALFRSWSVRALGEQISEENTKYEGCDLIVRPDVVENLLSQIQITPATAKLIYYN